MAIDTEREAVRALVDAVPDSLLAEARAALELLVHSPAPGFPDVPEDDEPITPEDLEAIREGHEEYLRGELIPHDVAMREIGL
jgi:hypothetical protein